jgi:hypothetical protein
MFGHNSCSDQMHTSGFQWVRNAWQYSLTSSGKYWCNVRSGKFLLKTSADCRVPDVTKKYASGQWRDRMGDHTAQGHHLSQTDGMQPYQRASRAVMRCNTIALAYTGCVFFSLAQASLNFPKYQRAKQCCQANVDTPQT